MASLLDMVVMQRNPRLAGLLGDGTVPPMQGQQAPQQAPPTLPPQRRQQGGGGGVLDHILSALTGPNDPSVSPEVNARARQQALTTAGLAALFSRGHDASVGEALLAGQEAASDLRNRALDSRRLDIAEAGLAIDRGKFALDTQESLAERTTRQNRAERMLGVFSDGSGLVSKARVDEALTASLRAGDFEAAGELRKLRSQLDEEDHVFKDIQIGDVTRTFRVADDGRLLDVVTGEPIDEDMFQDFPEIRTPAERQDRIDKLSDDARKDLQDAEDVATAVRIGLDTPNTAVGATTLFTMMTRAIDPGVSVREADIARGEAATHMKGRALNIYNKYLNDAELNADQFRWLKDELERVGRRQQDAMSNLRAFWERRSRDAGVDPGLVVPPSPFEGAFDDPDERSQSARNNQRSTDSTVVDRVMAVPVPGGS